MHLGIGWYIDGKLIHSPYAYTSWEYWLSHFRATFPDKAERMDAYSVKNGWGKWYADNAWYGVLIGWLDKQPTVKEAGL